MCAENEFFNFSDKTIWASTQETLSFVFEIHPVWSAPLLFAYLKVWYLNLLKAIFNLPASLYSSGDWFESHFVGNPKDRFCHFAAHIFLVQNWPFFLAHWIRISEILPWDRKSYLTHAILARLSHDGYIHWLFWNSRTWSSSDVIVML